MFSGIEAPRDVVRDPLCVQAAGRDAVRVGHSRPLGLFGRHRADACEEGERQRVVRNRGRAARRRGPEDEAAHPLGIAQREVERHDPAE
jgi:hypothetical protein